jgi:hypothetical protein
MKKKNKGNMTEVEMEATQEEVEALIELWKML